MSKEGVASKQDINRLRSEVRKLAQGIYKPEASKISQPKPTAPFTGGVTGNYWTQTGSPWVSDEARKAVLTEWFWQPIRRPTETCRHK